MTEQELDRIMRQVLIDSIHPREDETPENTPVFQPSARHRQQMRAMLANPLHWARSRTRPIGKRVLWHAAVAALVMLLGIGSIFGVSQTARAVVWNWIVERNDQQLIYRYSGEPDSEELPVYEIAALPDGYVEVERFRIPEDMPASAGIIYKNENGEAIYFSYVFMNQGSTSFFVVDEADMFDITVNGMRGQFFEAHNPEGLNTVTWIDPDHNLQFSLDGHFDCATILHIAESVFLCETPK